MVIVGGRDYRFGIYMRERGSHDYPAEEQYLGVSAVESRTH